MGRLRLLLAAVLAAGLVGAGVAVGAVASSKPKAVKVCVTSKGVVRAASKKGKCPKKTHKVSVAIKGPKGASGARGAKGATGAKGDAGPGAQGFEKKLAPGDPAYRVPGTETDAICATGPDLTLSTFLDDGNFLGTYLKDGTTGSARSLRDTGVGQSNMDGFSGTYQVALDGIFTPFASPAATVREQVSMIWLPASHECEVFGQVIPSA